MRAALLMTVLMLAVVTEPATVFLLEAEFEFDGAAPIKSGIRVSEDEQTQVVIDHQGVNHEFWVMAGTADEETFVGMMIRVGEAVLGQRSTLPAGQAVTLEFDLDAGGMSRSRSAS